MNKYQIEHIERMLIPLTDKIESLSKKIKDINHDFNNIRQSVQSNTELIRLVMKKSKEK
jgi:predicted  nucleic acid-binding Zn-ribbon protein